MNNSQKTSMRFPATVPRFLIAHEGVRTFVVHTQCPRFVAEVILDPTAPIGTLGYHWTDDPKEWATQQPEGVIVAFGRFYQDVGDFLGAYMAQQHAVKTLRGASLS